MYYKHILVLLKQQDNKSSTYILDIEVFQSLLVVKFLTNGPPLLASDR